MPAGARARPSERYEPKGEYQLIVESIEPSAPARCNSPSTNESASAAKVVRPGVEARDSTLPQRVGVVTSPNGAAIRDILHVISRRTRSSYPDRRGRVQGEGASHEMCARSNFLTNIIKQSAAGQFRR